MNTNNYINTKISKIKWLPESGFLHTQYVSTSAKLDGTVIDPKSEAKVINIEGYAVPHGLWIKRVVKSAAVRHNMATPVLDTDGEYQVDVLTIERHKPTLTQVNNGEEGSIRCAILSISLNGVTLPKAYEKNPAMHRFLESNKLDHKDASFRLSYLGALVKDIDGQYVKGSYVEEIGDYYDLSEYIIAVDRAIRKYQDSFDEETQTADEATFHIHMAEARRKALDPFNQIFKQEVLKRHKGWSGRYVVVDSSRVAKNTIVMGRKAADMLITSINEWRVSKGMDLMPVEQLHGMKMKSAVRFPVADSISTWDGTIFLAEDNTYCVFVNAEQWLEMGGDADGDTIMFSLFREDLRAQVFGLGIEIDRIQILKKITRIVRPNVDVRNFTPVTTTTPEQVALSLMGKDLVGTICKGMIRLSLVPGLLCTTPEERESFLIKAGIEYVSQDLRSAKRFRTLIVHEVKHVQSVLTEIVMDLRKHDRTTEAGLRESCYMPMKEVLYYLSDSGTHVNDVSMMLAGTKKSDTPINGRLLNAIKTLSGGKTPTQVMKQFPITASQLVNLKREATAEKKFDMNAVVDGVVKYGVTGVCRILDGTETEQALVLDEEQKPRGGNKKPEVIEPEYRDRSNFDWHSFGNIEKAICDYVNGRVDRLGELNALPLEIVNTQGAWAVSFFGKKITMPAYKFDWSGVIYVSRGGSDARVSRPIVTIGNLNAAKMINAGEDVLSAIRPEDIYLETLADRFAYCLLTQTQKYVNQVNTWDFPVAARENFGNGVTSALAKIYNTYTNPVNDSRFEVSLATEEVIIDQISSGKEASEHYEVILPYLRDLKHPITGEMIVNHVGVTSKNKSAQVGSIVRTLIRESGKVSKLVNPGTPMIDVIAHLLGGRCGINQARHWREARTTRFAKCLMNPESLKMLNGYEVNCQELIERFKDAVVLVADMSDYLNHGGIVSDSGYITNHGRARFEVEMLPRKEHGLHKSDLEMNLLQETGIAYSIDDEEDRNTLHFLGYHWTQDLMPMTKEKDEIIYEQTYTLIHPAVQDANDWIKLYTAGYKGVFLAIDQDFEVEIGGVRHKVDMIIDQNTFTGKKLQGEAIAGMLGLLGKTIFGDKAIYGENSLHTELMAKLESLGVADGIIPVFENGQNIGEGLAFLSRTCVLKVAPEDTAVYRNRFPETLDILNILGRSLTIEPETEAKLSALAHFIKNSPVNDGIEYDDLTQKLMLSLSTLTEKAETAKVEELDENFGRCALCGKMGVINDSDVCGTCESGN